MILVINVCKEKLHYYEFVKPIEDILKKEGLTFTTRDYQIIKDKDIEQAEKIIICGTSLKDVGYLNELYRFDWLKETEKPVLGICAGMQILGFILRQEKLEKWDYRKKQSRKEPKNCLYKNLEIGQKKENFKKEFLGYKGEKEVYYLHQYSFIFEKNFDLHTKAGIHNGKHTAIKHRTKPLYGTLFHPEVRNKTLITHFLKI